MAKGRGLAVLGVLLGLIGTGLGGYTFLTQVVFTDVDSSTESYVQGSWYDQKLSFVDALPSQEIGNITDLNVLINVKSNESVVFYYNSVADLYGWAYMNFWIAIDGSRISDSHIGVYITAEEYDTTQIPVAIVYSSSSITQGIHNITVAFNAIDTSQAVLRSRLFVQTYLA